jgi:hypothetical protein
MRRTIMKKFLLFFLLTFFSFPLFAQDDSTYSNKEEVIFPKIQKIGVFGGPSMKIGQINRTVGLFMGGEGGVILNNQLIIGGGGYSLITNVDASSYFEPKLELNMDYGGVIFGYIDRSNQAIHYSIHTLIGGGEISWSNQNSWLGFKGSNDNEDKFSKDSYFVIEPGVNIEMRLYKNVEMDFGLNYLFAFDVNSQITLNSDNGQTYIKKLGNNDLNGISGTLKVKFIVPDIQSMVDIVVDIIDDIKN